MLRLVAVVLVGGAALLAAPALASAAPITFNFGECGQITPALPPAQCPNADSLKNTLTYMSGGLSITTYGYQISPLTPAHLYVKNPPPLGSNPVETGLGIAAGGTDHEINSDFVVDLDVSNLFANGITSGDVKLSSVQSTENYMVCLEGTKGSVANNSSCIMGTGGNIVTLPNFGPWNDTTKRYIAITSGGSGDILVASSLVTTVPEPTTMVLFSTGAMGLALIRRRFGRKVRP